MNSDLVDKILNHARWDGPVAAPFYFLTMEDGGGWQDSDLRSKEQFEQHFRDYNQVWLPSLKELCSGVELGRPGIQISKIMSTLLWGNMARWREYRSTLLYMQHELNVKFFPISRKGTQEWPKKIELYTGLSKKEYEDRCIEKRIELFLNHDWLEFTPDHFFIIGASYTSWLDVLGNVFDLDAVYDDKAQIDFYYSKGRLVAAKFNILNRQLGDCVIRSFAARLLEERKDIAAMVSSFD